MSLKPDGERVRAYVSLLFKWRWLVLFGVLGIAALATSGARKIEFKSDYEYFFREDNPQLQAFEELQEVYAKNDTVLILLAPASGKVFTPETLAAVHAVTERAWQLPFATRVDSIGNFQYSRAQADDLIVSDLIDPESDYSPAELEELREIALKEPMLLHRLISEQAHVTAVNVRHTLPRQNADEATVVALRVRELAADIQREHPDISVYLTGNVMFSHSFFEASVQDLSTLIPVMYLVLLLTTLVFLRSFWGMLATLFVIALSVSTAMGLMGWMGLPITPPSAAAPTVIMTLAVADSIHLLVTFFQKMRQGLGKQDAMAESLRINFGPVFLTSLTTAIGLLGLNLSDVRPFNDLGNVASLGVGAAFVYSVVLLPALVALMPIRAPRTRESARVRPIQRLGDLVIRHQKPLLWASVLFVVGLGSMAFRNELNDRFIEYFDETFVFRTDTDFAMAELSGIFFLEYSLESGEPGGISNPEYLEDLDDFSEWLRIQPDVVHVYTLSDTLRRLNKNMHGDDPSWYELPGDRELAAQYLLLYEMSLPYGLDLNDQINVDKSSTRLIVTLDNVTAVRMREIQAQSEAWLEKNTPEAMRTVPASTSLMFSHISQRNIQSSILAALIAMCLIALILAIAFRSVRFGAISLIPNMIPALMAFGIWGLLDGNINVGNATVMTLSLGIIVDDTVHFLSKYLRARREDGLSPEGAVHYAFATVGPALVVTSFVLVAGFLVLSLSHFGLNAGMGLLTAIVLLVALCADLVFLPPLLMRLDKSKRFSSSPQPSASEDETLLLVGEVGP